jgi:hypothetical protein
MKAAVQFGISLDKELTKAKGWNWFRKRLCIEQIITDFLEVEDILDDHIGHEPIWLAVENDFRDKTAIAGRYRHTSHEIFTGQNAMKGHQEPTIERYLANILS